MGLLERVYTHYSKCSMCPLHESRRSIVFGNGSQDADILIIKSKPTEMEDSYGSYLTQDLKFLVKCYRKAIKSRMSIEDTGEELIKRAFITSSVLCRPAYVVGAYAGQDRKVDSKEIKACSTRLYRTVYSVDPLVIIAFGSDAVSPLKKLCPNPDLKPRLTGEVGEMFKAHIPGVYGDVPYSVIPAPDLHFAEVTGDYDYEAGKVNSVIRALKTATDLITQLKGEDQ